MATLPNTPPAPGQPSAWKEDLIFHTLSDPLRRKIIVALAKRGPQTALQLNPGNELTRDVALKHLIVLRSAGLITKENNPKDGRRSLYALSPDVPCKTTEEGCVIDFGFCVLRLK